MATLVDTTTQLDLNKDDAAELKRQRLRDKKRRQRQKQKEKKKSLTERRATENKGQGLFATQAIEEGSTVARQPPALSVVFDAHSQTVCGFCFRPDTTDKKTISLVKRDGKVGVVFADDADGAAVVTRLSATGANATADIKQGDVLIGVHGALVATTGQALEALRNAPTAFEAVFIRPSLLICRDCGRFATCKDCAAQGRHKWHAHECSLFQDLPASSKRGETSPVRLLLRYRATSDIGDWSTDKETIDEVNSLVTTKGGIDTSTALALQKLTGVPSDVCSLLIGTIRGNAAAVFRNNHRVACALSAKVGYCNHSCSPNCAASVDDEGKCVLTATTSVGKDEELTISYVDANQPVEQRRMILQEHYEFRCACPKCAKDSRALLKLKARSRGKEHLQNTSRLAREQYMHAHTKGGKATGV